jgi:phosphopantothenoylcysteine decarboxylase/phosphopantothenate--cysteine ligase
MSGSNLLFIVTGSIAGYKACDAISQLVQRGHRVRAVATPAALRFVGAATLEGLTGEAVLSDLFAPGAALEHIRLARWADATIICPATAHTLNRLAAGLADDLAGALFLAHDRSKPFLAVPAMNPAMWLHPATQASVGRLQEWGLRFIPVGEGRTACGDEGAGRLAEPGLIVAAVEAAVARPARRRRILVTSGGTAEPIDGVRLLTNASTGRTGAGLAAHFVRCGHEVVLLRSRDSAAAPPGCAAEAFFTFAELDAALTRWLGAQAFDAVVHAAAVGDFRVGAVSRDGVAQPAGSAKLDSHHPLRLDLLPNPKLVESLRARSRNPALCVVAFKLTQDASPAEARAAVDALLAAADADFVVHNDNGRRNGPPEAFPADIYRRGDAPAVACATRSELAASLETLLTDEPAAPRRRAPAENGRVALLPGA